MVQGVPTAREMIRMRGLGRVYTIEELKSIIIPILQRFDVTKAILFGSYAKGTATEQSDVDLLIRTERRGFDFGAILADLFAVLGYGNVDLYAEYELIEGSDLMADIRKTGVLFYDGVQSR